VRAESVPAGAGLLTHATVRTAGIVARHAKYSLAVTCSGGLLLAPAGLKSTAAFRAVGGGRFHAVTQLHRVVLDSPQRLQCISMSS
jgi:hypothetical protein